MTLVVTMLVLLALGLPVAFVLGIATIAQVLAEPGTIAFIWIPKRLTEGIATFQLLAVPFFILAAELMNTAGVTRRIFHFANLLVGHLRGGLGHVNIVASMIFSGMSGSAAADVAGLGKMEIKAMNDAGYDRSFSATVTACSGTIGPVIPPSIPLVVYGAIAEESIGRLLLAGAVPGLMLGLALMGVVAWRARQRDYPAEPFPGPAALGKAFLEAVPPLLTPVILVGGILAGIFTPTEAAMVAAGYALILSAFIYRELSARDLLRVFMTSGIETGKILFIIGMAFPLSLALTALLIPQQLLDALLALSDRPFVFLLCINFLLLVLGFFLDPVAAMIIAVPLLLVPAATFGVDPVHLGVVVVLNLMIGLVTPPFGMNMFIACSIAGTSIPSFVRECLPFYLAMVLVLLLVTYVPGISLAVPRLFYG